MSIGPENIFGRSEKSSPFCTTLFGVLVFAFLFQLLRALRANVLRASTQKLLYLLLAAACSAKAVAHASDFIGLNEPIYLLNRDIFQIAHCAAVSLLLFAWIDMHVTSKRRSFPTTVGPYIGIYYGVLSLIVAIRVLVAFYARPSAISSVSGAILASWMAVLMTWFQTLCIDMFLQFRYSSSSRLPSGQKWFVRATTLAFVAVGWLEAFSLWMGTFASLDRPVPWQEAGAAAIDFLSMAWWLVALSHPGKQRRDFVLNPVGLGMETSFVDGIASPLVASTSVISSSDGGEAVYFRSGSEGEDNVGSPRECWICYDDRRFGRMVQPCGCRGSVASVHVSCLKEWIRTQRGTGSTPACKVCRRPYQDFENTLTWKKISALGLAGCIYSTLAVVMMAGACGGFVWYFYNTQQTMAGVYKGLAVATFCLLEAVIFTAYVKFVSDRIRSRRKSAATHDEGEAETNLVVHEPAP